MKKKMFIALMCAAMLSGCADTQSASKRNVNSSSTVDAVIQAQIEKANEENGSGDKVVIAPPELTVMGQEETVESTPTPAEEEKEEENVVLSTTEGIDIDLTTLSSTMVYSEVYNMMYLPENYVGKTVKMEGTYSFMHDDVSGMDYYACIIQDATACCAQGIEFIPNNPEACPEEGGTVTVVGVFDTYMEGDLLFCTLRGAEVL